MSFSQNSYSRFKSPGAVPPKQQVAPPRMFNPNAPNGSALPQTLPPAQWNTHNLQEQQPYWDPNQFQPQQHIPQPQNQYHTAAQDQWNSGQREDPWNWGFEDAQETEPAKNQGWDSSVQQQQSHESLPYEQNVTHYQAPNNVGPPPANSFNSEGNYYPAVVNSNTVPTGIVDYSQTQPPAGAGNYYLHQPTALHAPSLVNYQNAPVVNNNTMPPVGPGVFNSESNNYYAQPGSTQLMAPTLVNYQNMQENFYAQQPVEQIMASDVTDYSNTPKTSYPNSPSVSTPGTDQSGSLSKPTNQVLDVSYQNLTGATSSMETLSSVPSSQLLHQGSTDDPTDNSQQSEPIGNEESGGLETASLPENDVSEDVQEVSELSASSMQRHQYMNLGVVSNNEFEYLNPIGSTTGNKGLAAQWSTESNHSQGSDDISTNTGGVHTPIDFSAPNYDQNQYENYPDSPLRDREVSAYEENHSPSNPTLNTVCRQIGELEIGRAVSTDVGHEAGTLKTLHTENAEVIFDAAVGRNIATNQLPPPPMNQPSRPNSKEPSPSPLMQLPPSGASSLAQSSGNPYSINRNSKSTVQVVQGSSSPALYNAASLPPLVPTRSQERVGEHLGIDQSWNAAPSSDIANFETIPDNKEHPDAVDLTQQIRQLTLAQQMSNRQAKPFLSPENQEVTPRWGPDRNQYLETGQLSEDELADDSTRFHSDNPNDWAGMERMIPGQNLTEGDNVTIPSNEVSTPPPGLHRMVPGQLTEQEDTVTQFTRPQFNDERSHDSNDDVLLRRMVPGRPTTEQPVTFAANSMTNYDIPPPGLRRMVPGESSSPASQGVSTVQTGSRVVTGDGQEESPLQPSSASQATARLKNDPPLATPASGSTQPTAERSETIGSDSVDTFQPPSTDNVPRRDTTKKDRHRRDDESSDERDGRRRDREMSPSSGRYKPESRQTKGDRDRHRDDDRRRGGDDRRRGDRKGEDRKVDDRRGNDRRGTDRRDDRRRRGDDRRGRDSDSESYTSDRYERDNYRRDKSNDSRRYRDERSGRHYEDYRDPRNPNTAYSRSRRTDHRGSGSEYSDYERRDYDRRPPKHDKSYPRRDYDPRQRSRHEEMSWYDPYDTRHYRADRAMGRPESRGNSSRMMYSADQQAWMTTAKNNTPEYWAFYNNLRETNPTAYARWYREVYMAPLAFSTDRGSVHSGRSSENNYLDRDHDGNETGPPASSTPLRSTPTMFSVAHARGKITSHGHLVHIYPNYPLDGQAATVAIRQFQSLNVFRDFPGPLIKGTTHKNSVIGFCNQKIQQIERDQDIIDKKSAILLWQYLILLIRQNGSAVGADIAELLLNDKPPVSRNRQASHSSSTSRHGSRHGSQHALDEAALDARFVARPSEEEVTNAYREHLLRGNLKEALDYATKHCLWGHALFLTSKMESRLHMGVMTHFLNSLAVNDPLQTLYQLVSNRQPMAVTSCSDEKWGEWQPHLAMILSNHTSPEVARKAIITLGDTLVGRGCLHAAHFCYLAGQVELSNYSERSTAKLILVGSSHLRDFQHFATNEAIQMTEILEYATKLRDADHAIASFQWFKMVYAKRLMELGLLTEALLYAEELSKPILSHPDHFDLSFIKQVFDLGDQLRYYDPVYTAGGEQTELQWLVRLEQTVHEFTLGICPQSYSSQPLSLNQSYSEGDNTYNQVQPLHNVQENAAYDSIGFQPDSLPYQPDAPYQSESAPYQQDGGPYQTEAPAYQQEQYQPSQYQDNQAYGQQSNMNYQPHESNLQQHETQGYEQSQEQTNTEPQSYQSPWDQNNDEQSVQPDPPRPQISLPNAYVDRDEKPGKAKSTKPSEHAKKSQPPRPKSSSSGWFGGIWDKLSLKPKNQMILPEDKNPTIVWDADRKQWINTDGDVDESSSVLAPPPKATDMPGFTAPSSYNPVPNLSNANARPTMIPTQPTTNQQYSNGAATAQPQSQLTPNVANGSTNRFKLNKTGKSFRANYVDVFGSSKMTTAAAPPPPEMFQLIPSSGQSSIFTPELQMSRWSSASSLSREVQSYTMRGRRQSAAKNLQDYNVNANDHGTTQSGPMMFSPSSYGQPKAVPSQEQHT